MTNAKSNVAGTLTALIVAGVLMAGTVCGIKTGERAVDSSIRQNGVLQADGTVPPAPPIKLGGSKRS